MARSRTSQPDIEEVSPGRFLLHTQRGNSTLRGEGTIEGRWFELQSQRREGLLARLRERGLYVRTLADRFDELPDLPAPVPIGDWGWRPLVSLNERYSYFDAYDLRWQPLEPQERDGQSGVAMRGGWAVRRRKSRGPASYYLVQAGRKGTIDLQPLEVTRALLIGYAQGAALDSRPLPAEWYGDELLLPDVELPAPHQVLLRLFVHESPAGLLVSQPAWPTVQELFSRLGVRIVPRGG